MYDFEQISDLSSLGYRHQFNKTTNFDLSLGLNIFYKYIDDDDP